MKLTRRTTAPIARTDPCSGDCQENKVSLFKYGTYENIRDMFVCALADYKDKDRKRVISGENIRSNFFEPLPNDSRKANSLKINQSDYNIVKKIFKGHLKHVKKLLEEGNATRAIIYRTMFHTIDVGEDNSRVTRLDMPVIPGPLPKTLLLKLDAIESLRFNESATLELCQTGGKLKGQAWLNEFTHLKHLSVTLGEGWELPECICDLTNLEMLGVDGGKRASFPSSIGKLSKLFVLDLNLEHPPEEIGNLTSLEILRMKGGVRSLPSSIGRLHKLKHLILTGANLKSLPEELWDLKSLESLDLSASRIQSLPRSIANLSNLKFLDLSRTRKMATIPNEIGKLTSLEELFLCYPRSVLPHIFQDLKNLRILHLDSDLLDSESSHPMLLELVKDCPRLGCFAYGHYQGSVAGIPDNAALSHSLMCNRAEGRLNANGIEVSTKVSLWPKILENPHRAFSNFSKCCKRDGYCSRCWCRTSKQIDQADAIFHLLKNHGDNFVKARREASAEASKNEALPIALEEQ